jgi:hypothetical protein
MSSLSFIGNSTSYLRIPNTNDFNFGTGDFTIEWYQYQIDSNSFPRIFQIGSYGVGSGTSIGVSIEGGQLYYWTNGDSAEFVKSLLSSEYKNVWVHFAISRSSGVTKIFMNGISIHSMNDTNNFNDSNDLIIGNESIPSDDAAFGGYITYFTWVKGIALYTSNFTVSNNYPTLSSDYVLLLNASTFDGTLGNTVVNNNVSTTSNVPPNFGNNNNNSTTTSIIRTNMRSLFSNNSMVYYKSNSLPSCGVGSVRNSSVKKRRT